MAPFRNGVPAAVPLNRVKVPALNGTPTRGDTDMKILQTDYSRSTLADVPSLVDAILALRDLSKVHVITEKTQSAILRQLPNDVLVAVAVELKKAEVTR